MAAIPDPPQEPTGAPGGSGASLWQASGEELLEGLVERERHTRQLQAEQGEILAEIASRGVSAEYRYPTMEALVRDVLHQDFGSSRRRVARATACNPTRNGTAEVPPLAPQTGAALREGSIAAEHVDAVVETLSQIPDTVPAEDRVDGERTLVELAQKAPPSLVRRAGTRLLGHLDPDGARPKDDTPERPKRELRTAWRRDGSLGLVGTLDQEAGKALATALSSLSKPQKTADGSRDPRTLDERQGDALADIVDCVLREGELPVEGGEKPRILVTIPLEDLCADAAGSGLTGLLDNDLPISAETARRWACDAGVIPAVLGGKGEVLDLGREQRTVSAAQRRALNLRDAGCVFPTCDRSHRWCHAHHLEPWAQGGPTDLNNLALLCARHHTLIHESQWTITMGADQHPHCHPPPWMPRSPWLPGSSWHPGAAA